MSNRDQRISTGSTPSNIGGSLTRINSVTNVLKRLFSKEDRPDGNSGTKTPGRLPNSTSSASLRAPGKLFVVSRFIFIAYCLRKKERNHFNCPSGILGVGGSMRIGVIEEVDEQMTMTSIRPENRPHVQSIFSQGPPPASAPVDVPGSMSMAHNGDIFSTSAPVPALSGSADSTDTLTGAGAARYRGGTRYSINV